MLEHDELSTEAYKTFKKTFKQLGVHLGDAEIEYYGEHTGDYWMLYVADKPMSLEELEEKLDD